MSKITLFDFPQTKIYVLLTKDFRRKLIKRCIQKLKFKNYYELANWINSNKPSTKFNGGDIKRWLVGENIDVRTGKNHPKLMPLWVIKKLVNLLGIKSDIFHKNILAYRSGGSGSIITNPKLPIMITPELESIVIHLFCDGYVGKGTPAYYQKDRRDRALFVQKLKNSFGDFAENIYENKWQVRFPKAITDILSKYYRINSFLSNKSKIPNKILNGNNKSHKLACLLAFILDEGSIRDVIVLHSINKRLLQQLKSLTTDIGYICKNIILKDRKTKCYSLTISNKCVKKLLRDTKELMLKYPACSLGRKHQALEYLVARRTKRNPKKYSITNNLILKQIKQQPMHTMDISRKIGYAHCTVLHHLEDLYKAGKVTYKNIDKNYYWQINKK